MAFKSKAEVQASLNTLIEFFKAQKDGSVISWVEVEQATSVRMSTNADRELARRALRRLKRPYSAIVGSGIELSSPINAAHQAGSHARRAWRGIKRASDSVDNLAQRHEEQMNTDDRQYLIGQRAMLGGLVAAGKQSRKVLPVRPVPPGPMLPKT